MSALPGAFPTLYLKPVVLKQIHSPTNIVNANDGSGRLFVVDQPGKIYIIQGGMMMPTPFLNIASPGNSTGNTGPGPVITVAVVRPVVALSVLTRPVVPVTVVTIAVEVAIAIAVAIEGPVVPLPVPALPESWIAARAWMVAPVADEVHDEWVRPIPAGTLVGVAWQGLLRHLVDGQRVVRKPPVPSALIRRADVVGVSHHDVAAETPLADLWALLRPGAVLAVTQGHEGGLLLTLGADGPIQTLRWRATLSDREVDPTGAGDTFLAALVATAAHPNIGGRQRTLLDLRVAAAAGSLVVEDWGLAGVPDRTEVITRLVRERVRRIFGPARADTVGSYAHEG